MVRRLSAVLVLSAAVLVAGCGGDDDSETSSATEWADGVCSAVTSWTESLTSATQSLTDGGLSQDGLETAVDDVKDATSSLVDDLKDLGAPDTEAGQQAKESLDTLGDELSEEVDKIESAAEDASGASGVLSAVSTISGTLVAMGNQVSSTFNELEQLDAAGELEDAFEQAESCSRLTETTS
jgi:hypothetical protein